MILRFKVYNKEIIDCSSCHNTVYPIPESSEILLDILLGICESDAVAVIAQFGVTLNNILLHTPEIIANNYDKPTCELQTGIEAESNKIANVYLENETDARQKLNEDINEFIKESHYIEPGLKGICKIVKYIKCLKNDQRELLPDYLKKIELKGFGIVIGVIWKMDQEERLTLCGSYDLIDYERDIIHVISTSSEIHFSFSNNDNNMIYTYKDYLTHLDIIQDVLDKIAPGKYEADPFDREELLEIGYLKRKGRHHIVPSERESRELEITQRKYYQNKYRGDL